ncbi:response regulator transcription factor [Noviherbaspirillum sp.]|uniref:response regulator transcription factor n=1 Tax=Noviherbaspirillum sp. TaxID=1926288 RepID=UPI002B484428|nr:sigma-70 family RNA polymerase sigma factor [Noviherbaspirillum sp.]HJV80951.1 sigma-70 family RNA polymerase sigma factor [Noviherbaspirillum sp.]
MPPSGYTVFIVDDDQSVRDALGLLLSVQGYPITLFADAESCLAAYRPDWRGCILIDIRMPGIDGLALQKRLLELGSTLPVIVMTGHGDVESAREAFRSQAVDFLEKPIDHDKLMAAIDEAFRRQSTVQEAHGQAAEFEQLLATLTAREREVMELVVAGRHNREIADLLGISPRTVEVHKARMMAKLGTQRIPDLVRLMLQKHRGSE